MLVAVSIRVSLKSILHLLRTFPYRSRWGESVDSLLRFHLLPPTCMCNSVHMYVQFRPSCR